ncbi:hypothetical protein K0M31_014184, partial [Melipona bicolor]
NFEGSRGSQELQEFRGFKWNRNVSGIRESIRFEASSVYERSHGLARSTRQPAKTHEISNSRNYLKFHHGRAVNFRNLEELGRIWEVRAQRKVQKSASVHATQT